MTSRGLIDANASDDVKRSVLGRLCGSLQAEDWDTEDESLSRFRGDPVIVAMFAEHDVHLHCDECGEPQPDCTCNEETP